MQQPLVHGKARRRAAKALEAGEELAQAAGARVAAKTKGVRVSR